MAPLKVGIASFKHMHAYSYHACLRTMSGVEVVAIAEEDGKIGARVRELAPKFHKTYDRLARDPGVDAVLVTSETALHEQIAVAALEAGKHVIVEKPIATTLQGADAMIRAATKNAGQLIQCYPCRYHPSVDVLSQRVEQGKIGEILAISATNHGTMPDASPGSPYRWFTDASLAGGGAIMDHTTHVVDLIFHLTGTSVDRVFARAGTLFHPDITVEDAGMVTIAYKSGMKASIDPSWSRPSAFPTWGDVTMTLYGTRETVYLDMFAQHLAVTSQEAGKMAWVDYGSNMDQAMLRDFVDCLRLEQAPPVTGKDGRKALEVALAAYESSRKGNVVVLQ